MLTTLQQAKKLKELGCKLLTHAYYSFDEKLRFHTGIYDWNTHASKDTYAVPSVAEALEWFREVKGIECEVCLRLCFMSDTDEAVFGGYEYIIFDHNTNKTISSSKFYDRKVAESALLDEVMKYVEGKQ